eukprot:281132-Chlamydomonas_euryale.AAC.1
MCGLARAVQLSPRRTGAMSAGPHPCNVARAAPVAICTVPHIHGRRHGCFAPLTTNPLAPHFVLCASPHSPPTPARHTRPQHNRLESLEGLASLPNLKFCCAAHNRLSGPASLAGLSQLGSLMFLDVSHNRLAALGHEQLPRSLCFMQ